MRNALSGKIGTWWGVLQDRRSLLFDMPCGNPSASTLLNFALDSIYQEDTAGSIFFSNLSFHSLFLAECFTLSQAESALDGKFSCCFAFFCPPTPTPGSRVLQLSVLSSSCFTRWVCTDWPAASVYACFDVGATASPLLWVVNIQDSIFGWCDWSLRWQSRAFVPWLDDWTFVNYFCQKWSLLCD